MHSRRNLIRFALTACAVLAAGIVALLSQHADVVEQGYEDVSCRRFLPEGLMGLAQPNCDGVRNPGGTSVPIHFNSHGFRDTEHGPIPGPGVFRIALLGASMHVAPGLPESANPARLIEARLSELGLPKVEVLNFSVEGFATVHHLANFYRYLKEHPHLVLLDTLNGYKPFRDYWLQAFENPEAPLGSFHPFYSAEHLLPVGLKWITRWRPLLRFFLHLKQAKEHFVYTRQLLREGPDSAAQARRLLSHSITLVDEMKRRCRSAGADFAVIWDGEPLTNTVALRQNDSSVLAHVYGPLLAPVSIPPETAMSVLQAAGELIADISGSVPARHERRNFLGTTYYYSREGMEKYARAVAEAVAPIIRKHLAHPPRPEAGAGPLSSGFR